MIGYDTEVHVSEESDACSYAYLVVLPLEAELLLVDGGRGKDGGLYAFAEPVREVCALSNGFEGFAPMLHALCGTYPEGNNAAQHLAFVNPQGIRRLFVRQSNPARVELQRLRKQHNALAVVTKPLVKAFAARPDEGDVVADVSEFAVVGLLGLETMWLVGDKLKVQSTLLVAAGDVGIQCLNLYGGERSISIFAHGVTGEDGFVYCHIILSYSIGWS